MVATFSGKRLFGYKSVVYATAAIGLLSFTVWLHHFFTMGESADVNIFFGIATMCIGVPTGVKIYDWLMTMYRGRVRLEQPMYWTLGFIVTFVIGGMSGILLAIAPVDYLMHNSVFLVAHFHNMLIPGSVFGYFAGYCYWFPKAFGFKLDDRWGKRAFWAWIVGFYLAFMPLYVLGFMGMPRRMDHYATADWQPWLILAEAGAVLIGFGIVCQIIQLVYSIRHRHELRVTTGDPWDGRTLEWMTSSPPAPYNFAVIPRVHDLDEFAWRKRYGGPGPEEVRLSSIVMPDNTGVGVILGGLSFVFGFAMVWHIWWLAALAGVGMFTMLVMRSSEDHDEHLVGAEEVRAIETHVELEAAE